MTGAITWEQIISLLGISCVVGAVWWRLQNQITNNLVKHNEELAAYKLHVAEAFVSKQGHRETMDQVMDAITAVKQAIDGTNLRIDRMWESGTKPTSSRAIK